MARAFKKDETDTEEVEVVAVLEVEDVAVPLS